ncbi:GntR family transcriptional regulator [Thalassospira lucentensis]|uniref:GntR family transcriptional regulator n=2 Tax=Thalassospira TaxID=168934 RepID=A0A154KRD2_9PROT|nr:MULTISPECIES: GntR family transcriptional regulator [Thalassospira]MBO9506597.1 UTRA domain-containing protein [Thalassospira sp. A3_1]KZB52599.1 GntR family transcriptional regulator [Thalassospira xiamenensis]KZB65640.1 GntR family transcriptional regulator [Thalassospira lucentensis]MCK2168156.1 GntR family transcriptional regulator [Thalassospira xiamenensis]RCK53546.1 GntR family transcriptional regulator [Thalassospira xiamenensis]
MSTTTELTNWQSVHDEVLRRIHTREWKPGDQIPKEVELAEELGCARATVNRALRELAAEGFLDRRRKAGTRVAAHPVRRARLDIPVIRLEIEGRGQKYTYGLLLSERRSPPPEICANLGVTADSDMLHITSLHLADGKPYMFEERWVSVAATPEIVDADLSKISANEWLVLHAPYTKGDISFSAVLASENEAKILRTQKNEPLFLIERTTWEGEKGITSARLVFAPGYRMHTAL